MGSKTSKSNTSAEYSALMMPIDQDKGMCDWNPKFESPLNNTVIPRHLRLLHCVSREKRL